MRQQKIIRNKPKPTPNIVNEKQLAAISKETATGSDLPVRTIYYVEIQDMDASRYGMLLDEINRAASKLKGGAHYVIPVRNGKIRTDIAFEKEFLDVVHQVCEVKNNEIVLKNGAQDVIILREKV